MLAKRCLHLKKEKTLLGAFACRCETSRRIVESSSGVSSPVAVTCRIGRYWQCKQCRHFTAACKDWILCPRGYSGYWHGSQQITQPSMVMCVYWYWHYLMQNIVTMAASVSSPDWPIVCLLIMLVAGGSWHRHNGAVCVTAWHGRDANCGNIIYTLHNTIQTADSVTLNTPAQINHLGQGGVTTTNTQLSSCHPHVNNNC